MLTYEYTHTTCAEDVGGQLTSTAEALGSELSMGLESSLVCVWGWDGVGDPCINMEKDKNKNTKSLGVVVGGDYRLAF